MLDFTWPENSTIPLPHAQLRGLRSKLADRLTHSDDKTSRKQVELGNGRERISLASLDSKLYALGQEIEAAAKLLHTLLREQQCLETSRARRLNALRPVNRLPDEVLSIIFAQCGPGQLKSPFLRTCHLWRHIAVHHTPELWSNIYLSWKHGDATRNKLALWLERSCAIPIDFVLILKSSKTMSPEEVDAIKADVRPALARCKKFNLSVEDSDVIPRLFPLFLSSSVRQVDIKSLAWRDTENTPIQIFDTALNSLDTLTFSSQPGIDFTILSSVRWNTLSKLELTHGVSRNEIMQILPQCSALEHLLLQSTDDTDSASIALIPNQSIVLNSLKFLCLTCSPIHPILKCIAAPNLDTLILRDLGHLPRNPVEEEEDPNDIETDISMIMSVGPLPTLDFPLLRTLKLDLEVVNTSGFKAFIGQFPVLHKLFLPCCDDLDEILRDLNLASLAWNKAVCPTLRKLTILGPREWLDLSEDSVGEIIGILQSYLKGREGGRLHPDFRIKLKYKCCENDHWRDEVQSLAARFGKIVTSTNENHH